MARAPKKGGGMGLQYGGGPGLLMWLGLAFIIVLIDQFTKVLVVGYYHLGDSTTVTSFFMIVPLEV